MKDLAIYLNDRLAGSTAAMEMVQDLIEAHQGERLEGFLRPLREDIQSDQGELRSLMEGLGVEESKLRKTGAWMAEKASRLKLRVADFGEPNLALLQSLETLSIGIMGKRLLWRTLDATIAAVARKSGLDLLRLERRAGEQFERVEREVFRIARVKSLSARSTAKVNPANASQRWRKSALLQLLSPMEKMPARRRKQVCDMSVMTLPGIAAGRRATSSSI